MTHWLDRAITAVSPRWGAQRARARAALMGLERVGKRHFEAAAQSRRTEGWSSLSQKADGDMVAKGVLALLRGRSRDLIRNNGWARRIQNVVANNTVGWGIEAKITGEKAEVAQQLWRQWATSKDCSVGSRKTFIAIQRQVMRTLVESGEVLIRRRFTKDPTRAVPLEVAVLEPDYLDSDQSSDTSHSGGPIVSGVEFDRDGRRAGYWLFDEHPGSGRSSSPSKFVPAMDVEHIYAEERPGQTRGISWLAAALVPLKDLADLEDAELVKQKVAACFAALVTDPTGEGAAIGDITTSPTPLTETLEPGLIAYLPSGRDVTFGSPPQPVLEALPQRTLRRACAALGVVYEEVSGDWSQVNFSSARMARIAHWGNVYYWQHDILIPQLCQPVFGWFVEAAELKGLLGTVKVLPTAEWTPPPMPMLEPDKEGAAYSKLIRNGIMSLPAALREQGLDPETHLKEIAESNKRLDALGIKLDSDPREMTAQGQGQFGVAAGTAPQATAGTQPAKE